MLLETLANDRSFELTTKDEVFEELDEVCGPDIEYLIAGHTHLRRARERVVQRGKYYFNSGTWIRILRIPKAMLSEEQFPEVERRLRDGSMEELEKPLPDFPEGLVHTLRTVVCIEPDGRGVVRGMLLNIAAVGASWRREVVPGSTLPPAASAT